MKLKEFEEKINEIRIINNWTIRLELVRGVWVVQVFDESDKFLASTGATSLTGILKALEMPFDKCPWK